MRPGPATEAKPARPARRTRRARRTGAGALLVLAASGCQDEVPTAGDAALVPLTPTSIELRFPLEVFGRDVRVFGGFGRAADFSDSVSFVSRDFGDLGRETRTLVRFGPFPRLAAVRDSSGTVVADSTIVLRTGRVVFSIDTTLSTFDGPVDLSIGAISQAWDPRTASWRAAVDSVDGLELWSEPGGGSVRPLGVRRWDPSAGDTVSFAVDSATVAEWADTTLRRRGLRIDAQTDGVQLRVNNFLLSIETLSDLAPDTVVFQAVTPRDLTFVYDPLPDPPATELRVGGAPAWRTSLRLELPEALDGPPELCALVECPLVLQSDAVNSASLILRTQANSSSFVPQNSIFLDVRPVATPERLPKAPLGASLVGLLSVELRPEAFTTAPGREVVVPMTGFVQDLIDGPVEDGIDPPSTVTLLSVFEPSSLGFATFAGAGTEGAPQLRLILTVAEDVRFR